jgi:vancomycin resistance protein VanW
VVGMSRANWLAMPVRKEFGRLLGDQEAGGRDRAGAGVRQAATDGARRWAGPGVRRVRRELQWTRTGRRRFRLCRAPGAGFGHPVADHATPLVRRLVGLDPQLQLNKVVNLRLAVARLDGLVVRPEQRFSFWWHVGAPTARRGYLPGLVLDSGRLTEGVGGGLCQLTNLIYWMSLHTPLTVVERWRHSHDVFPDAGRTQPFGSGATCAWPALDLQIDNRTATSFRLALTVTRTHLVGAWTADAVVSERYQIYEAAHLITNDLPGIFVRHNELRRRALGPAGEVVADEPVTVNHALMRYAPFLEPPPGAASIS